MSPPPVDPSLRVDVPCDLTALHAARARISTAASGWGFQGLADLDLVVSELVTNAIIHGQTPSVATCASSSRATSRSR
jgi:anti-sigma regulatory factor (Ser/Thr protein kinase)